MVVVYSRRTAEIDALIYMWDGKSFRPLANTAIGPYILETAQDMHRPTVTDCRRLIGGSPKCKKNCRFITTCIKLIVQ